MFANVKPADPFHCAVCLKIEKLSRCARCGNAYYCCREHQIQHWKIHQNDCKSRQDVASAVSSSTDIRGRKTNSPRLGNVTETVGSANVNTTREVNIPLLGIVRNGNQSLKTTGVSSSREINLPLTGIAQNVNQSLRITDVNTTREMNISLAGMAQNVSQCLRSTDVNTTRPMNAPLSGMAQNVGQSLRNTDVNTREMNVSLSGMAQNAGQVWRSNDVSTAKELNVAMLDIAQNVNEEVKVTFSPVVGASASSSYLPESAIISKNVHLPIDTRQATNLFEAGETSSESLYKLATAIDVAEKSSDFPLESDEDLFSSFSSELLSSSNNFWDMINNDPQTFPLDFNLDIPNVKADERVVQHSVEDLNLMPPIGVVQNKENTDDDLETMGLRNVPIYAICNTIISDLNNFGICVIDKFLGSKVGDLIAAEVRTMFLKGIFKKGELVGTDLFKSHDVRGDVITWVNGNEPGCLHVGNLIKMLDVVVTACNKMPNNGILSRYKLNRRTKAMIACYPGDGTHYKKHVDNPHGDGRCITCIYYLNKNWDVKTHGGLLRMFPASNENQLASIEPIFDRMLFFWSDRRNPHEVLPSYATRFALTVWYFDSDERDRALLKSRSGQT